jgi:hypothetical protein
MAETYYLSTLASHDNATPRSVANEIATGDLEAFAARFINGLVQQAYFQTGHVRPIGDVTAIRIARELFAFAEQQTGVERPYDYAKLKTQLRLDIQP